MAGKEISMERLGRTFFERPPDDVARELIGAQMTIRQSGGAVVVRIVETEAYGGDDDAASHAYRGRTARNRAMFGPGGHLYVYRSYGVHWCMNVVTQKGDIASAVLLRAAELMASETGAVGLPEPSRFIKGPGNLTRALGVTGDDDGRDCCHPLARITFELSSGECHLALGRSARIGISKARERLSRYYLEGSPAVSKTPRVLAP
jgi:DNA-3-methyladenine glycosylase